MENNTPRIFRIRSALFLVPLEWGLADRICERVSQAIRTFLPKSRLMNPFFRKHAIAAFSMTLIALSGCTKYADRDDGRFRCECGNLDWNGRNLELRMAEVVPIDSVTYAYHVIADLRTESQIDAGIPAKDIVFDLVLGFDDEEELTLESGDATFTIQELQAPASSADWFMERAVVDVDITETNHVFELRELRTSRNGVTVNASGEFIFDLDD